MRFFFWAITQKRNEKQKLNMDQRKSTTRSFILKAFEATNDLSRRFCSYYCGETKCQFESPLNWRGNETPFSPLWRCLQRGNRQSHFLQRSEMQERSQAAFGREQHESAHINGQSFLKIRRRSWMIIHCCSPLFENRKMLHGIATSETCALMVRRRSVDLQSGE